MGTNYYWYEKYCKECGRPFEPLHIGKSSGGWCFSLHVIPEEGINTLDDWKKKWSKIDSFIKNEYDSIISTDEMIDIITNRSWQLSNSAKTVVNENWLRSNHAEHYGPHSRLVRAKIDGVHCIGHGPGTWDYIIGEFG